MPQGRITHWIAAAVAVLASQRGTAATSENRWPGALARIRQQPWWWGAGRSVAGILVAVVLARRQERPVAVAGDPPTLVRADRPGPGDRGHRPVPRPLSPRTPAAEQVAREGRLCC
ncbi:hypothetical protein GCM10017778_46310 [Streptomyces vinaceus]|nr:hypothetical protein GCM10017778_46310 [Streptomyces vinaceus]